MDSNNFLIIVLCAIGIFFIGLVFKIKIGKLIKIIINSILGGIIIYLINKTGLIHIGLNILTSAFIGILGIPGAILLTVLKIF